MPMRDILNLIELLLVENWKKITWLDFFIYSEFRVHK